MALVDRCGDARPVAMLGLDRFSEPGIVRPQFQLECAPLHGETLLQHFKSRFLVGVQRQLMMQHVVQLRAGLGTWRK